MCNYDGNILSLSDPESYEVVVARKRNVYKWLKSTNSEATSRDSDAVSLKQEMAVISYIVIIVNTLFCRRTT